MQTKILLVWVAPVHLPLLWNPSSNFGTSHQLQLNFNIGLHDKEIIIPTHWKDLGLVFKQYEIPLKSCNLCFPFYSLNPAVKTAGGCSISLISQALLLKQQKDIKAHTHTTQGVQDNTANLAGRKKATNASQLQFTTLSIIKVRVKTQVCSPPQPSYQRPAMWQIIDVVLHSTSHSS